MRLSCGLKVSGISLRFFVAGAGQSWRFGSIWSVSRVVRAAQRGLIRGAGNITDFILRRVAGYRNSAE
jgi:hypothetical protein